MKTITRFSFFVLLVLAVSGCASQGGGLGTGAGLDAPSDDSNGGTTGPVAASGREDVLGPRTDSERLGEDLFAVEGYYGPDLSERLAWDHPGGVALKTAGLIDLPLRVQYAIRTREDMDFDWVSDERGLQVRLVHVVRGETSTQERYIDALTVGRQTQGHNVLFTGLDLGRGGSIEVFLFDSRATRAPTEDFSATFRELPAGTTAETLRRTLPFAGTIPLAKMEAVRRDQPTGEPDFVIFEEAEAPRVPPPPAYLSDVLFLPLRRTD